MKALIIALVLLWASVAGASGLVLGTGCTGSPCGNSHALIIINAEPFVGGTFIDSSSYARVVTNVGVTQSAAQVKFGTQSMLIDANADKISIPDDPVWMLPTDFNVSVWIYVAAWPGVISYLFSQGGGVAWRGLLRNTGQVNWDMWDAGAVNYFSVASAAAAFPVGSWVLVEVSRRGDSGALWLNGTSVATDATAAGIAGDSAVDPSMNAGVPTTGLINGYFDAWTITSGGWAWNRNHTVPNRRW